MPQPQLELWSAQPHPTAPIYPQLTPQQRSRLANHLAELMLKLIQDPPVTRPSLTLPKSHER